MYQKRGNLYTTNPAGLKKYSPEKNHLYTLQITRGGLILPNVIVVRDLAPSTPLFQRFLQEWKGNSPREWWHIYEKNFKEELQTEEKLQALRIVYKMLLSGYDVVLVCFCKDHRYCHRRLVGEFFKPYGIKAIELNPVFNDQLTFF